MNVPRAFQPASRPATLPIAALLVNAFIWGVSWIAFRHVEGLGLHSLWTTAGLYAVCTLAVLAWWPGAAGPLRGSPWLVLLALASGLTNACFNWGVTIGEVVRVVLLFYLMPVWAALLARALLGEPLSAAAAARIALAVVGAAIVLWKPGVPVPLPQSLPDWLGLAGGAAFALTNVLLRRQAHEPARARALAMFVGAFAVPALLAALLAASSGADSGPVAIGWPVLDARIVVAVIATGGMFLVANLALQYGAARLPSSVTAIVMISEVVFAAGSAVLLGDETLTARTLIGGTLIVVASLFAAFSEAPADPQARRSN